MEIIETDNVSERQTEEHPVAKKWATKKVLTESNSKNIIAKY